MAEIEQALFGYNNGHQLLASSIRLPSDTARQLRALTDMAFDGRAERYLTALPLPALRRYALIRTWPAPEAPRRGSVWSHALLIDLVVLGSLDRLTDLTTLFRRPATDANDELARYGQAMPMPTARSQDAPRRVTRELDSLLWTIYGQADDAILWTDDAELVESHLLAVWQQQWPRLRRTFAFRTRYRVAAQSSPFDVQVVERLERNQTAAQPPEPLPAWLERLRSDLYDPQRSLATFLRRFGTESDNGRGDLPALVRIAALLEEEADNTAVIRAVGSAFGDASEMRSLKLALLGLARDASEIWHASEAQRLELLLYATPHKAFDLDHLQVEPRLDALWSANRAEARTLLQRVDFSSSENPECRAALLSTAIRNAHPADLAAISGANPEVALAVIKRRSDLLAEPSLWEGDSALVDSLLDLVADAGPRTREDILLRLLNAGAFDGAARLIESEPSLWWQVLQYAAHTDRRAVELAGVLGRLLDSVGAGAIGAMPDMQRTDQLLRALAVSVPPPVGLWRQVGSKEWMEAAPQWAALPERWAQLRMLVVLLAAARSARREDVRRALWREAFPPLHDALIREELHGSELAALVALLPTPAGIQEWDHAGRLRAALAIEIRRNAWPAEDVKGVVRAARPYEEALLKALAAGKKKKKSWLRELTDQILP